MKRRRLLPDNVSGFKDRHGKLRLRYRKKGRPTHYFTAPFGTEQFRIELRACEDGGLIAAGAGRAAPGTIDDLLARYYRSTDFKNAGPVSQAKNRGILEMFRAEHGSKTVANIQFEHIDALLATKAETHPAAARNLRKQLRRLFEHAVRVRIRPDNPVAGVRLASRNKGGHHTWTEEEIAQYQERHPLGTMARLAMELMLWTGNRRGDATRLGPQHIKGGRFVFAQEKGDKPMKLTIAPDLAQAILAMPATGHLAFLVTEYGRPFTPAGFGGRFRKWCDAAGLPHCSAHGLRKAISRRMAEMGAGNQGIKAVTGHSSDSEVAHYTREADQMALADQMIASLSRWVLATPKGELANDKPNPLKGNR